MDRYPIFTIVFVNLVLLIMIFSGLELGLRFVGPNWLHGRMEFMGAGVGDQMEFGSDRDWKIVKKGGLFHSFEPGSSWYSTNSEYRNKIQIDEIGGRRISGRDGLNLDSEVVVFTGDSFMFGIGADDEETFAWLLQESDKDSGFVNLSVPGTGLVEQTHILRSRLKEFPNLKKVVVAFYLGNDFRDLKRELKSKESFNFMGEPAKRKRSLSQSINDFVNNSSVLSKSYSLQYVKAKLMSIVYRGKWKDMEPIFMVMSENNDEYIADRLSLLNPAVKELKELVSSRGAELQFVYVPDRYQVYSDKREDRKVYYSIPDRLDPLLPNKLLSGVLSKNDIDYIDPTECMIEVSESSSEPLYFTQDLHFTPEGNRVFYKCIKDEFFG